MNCDFVATLKFSKPWTKSATVAGRCMAFSWVGYNT